MARSTGGRRATIVDVANAAGVSRQTVSNALNSPEKLAPDTLSRVLAAVEEADYRPSAAARSLRQRRAHAIGIELNVTGSGRLGSIVDPFLVELTIAARTHRTHVVPFVADDHVNPFPAYDDLVHSRTVDAFILVDTRHDDPRPDWLADRGVPYVAFGRIWGRPDITSWADVDGRAGTRAAVEHLIEAGYERIAFLGWPEGSETGDDRRRGWRETLQDHGRFDESLQASTLQELAAATQAAVDLIRSVGVGGAVVCASDVLAMGVIRACRDAGLRIGADIGVVGFDDSPTAELLDLTTARQPVGEVAAHLVALADALSEDGAAPGEGRLFQPTLTVRASTDRTAAVRTGGDHANADGGGTDRRSAPSARRTP